VIQEEGDREHLAGWVQTIGITIKTVTKCFQDVYFMNCIREDSSVEHGNYKSFTFLLKK
jgi:hypothetical protein